MARVELLTDDHVIEGFSSGNDELDAWLTHAALTAQRAGTSRVHVWVEGESVIGYFAFLPHSVRRLEMPQSVGRGSPDVVPGFLLGRLALASRHHDSGRGGELLALALERVLAAIRSGGGRVIVVDAIDDNAVSFYQHFGFKALPDYPNRLFLKASSAAASLEVPWP